MRNEIRRIRLSGDCLGGTIEAEAILFPEGIRVSVYGGDLPHIGAVSIVDLDGHIETTQFPGHKDAAVSEAWAGTLSQLGRVPAVVEVGIHYDGLSRDGIREVLKKTDELLTQMRKALE